MWRLAIPADLVTQRPKGNACVEVAGGLQVTYPYAVATACGVGGEVRAMEAP